MLCPPPRTNCGSAVHTKNGFNLIESAIVLGVVGLVIGGIWVAANAVRENHMVNNLVSATMEVVQNMRKLYGRGGAGTAIPSGNITDEMIKAGVIPADFKASNGFNCWNGGAVGASSPDDSEVLLCVYGSGSNYFVISVTMMSTSQCIKFVSKLQATSGDMVSMELADTYNHTTPGLLLPIPPDLIKSECEWNYGNMRITYSSN